MPDKMKSTDSAGKKDKAAAKKPAQKSAAPGRSKKGTGKGASAPAKKAAGKGTGAAAKGAAAEGTVKSAAPEDFYVVGIGASAGGLEAFEQFFSNMPPDSGMAFVLVPHLDPRHKSMMTDLLKRYTGMEVGQAKAGTVIRPDHIYIIPPNKDMTIKGGRLTLHKPSVERGIKHPIDLFMQSLARDKREKAICIIMSGTGSEGALGLRAIKEEGGLVMIQKGAKYEGMPSSALETGLEDFYLPADKMPGQLIKLVKLDGAIPVEEEAAPHSPQAGAPLKKVLHIVRSSTGHDFSQYKRNTIMRRVQRRMMVLQLSSLEDYARYLSNYSEEVGVLFSELLIRVTNFFRDEEAFKSLAKEAFPGIMEGRAHDDPVRIWVPGCSTGEEAYSLAILADEFIARYRISEPRFQIFATDIDAPAIDEARAGVYPDSISTDVSPARLKKYFVKNGGKYRVSDEIRERVVFAVHSVFKDPPFSRLDLVSCRNVLIYMDSGLQKRILPILHYALKPGGFLFLGPSETVGDSNELFSVVDNKWRIFRSRGLDALSRQAYSTRAEALGTREPEGPCPELAPDRRPIDVGGMVDKLMLENYTPACVILNEQDTVLYFHGRTGRYLEPPTGRARLYITEMAREGLRAELAAGLRSLRTGKKDVNIAGVNVKSNGGYVTVDLDIRLIKAPENLKGLVMVVFRERPQPELRTKRNPKSAKGDDSVSAYTQELELELKSTRQRLHSTVEEMETTNEELKSANEELQSTNEELQSTNEELETSREELQSTNEELLTVNSELQQKLDELSQANSDIMNLIGSIRIATIFLDRGFRIKRFTPEAAEVVKLIESDVGRPIGDISSMLAGHDPTADSEKVLKDLTPIENTIKHRDGRWFIVRTIPYRTVKDKIDGVVITFIDITGQKTAQEKLEDTLAYTEGILETVREPLVVLDSGLRVKSANKSFYEKFRVSQRNTEGRLIYELGNRQWDIPGLRNLLEKILPESSRFNDYKVEHDFNNIGRRKMLLNARRIIQHGEKTQTILLAIEDITDKEPGL